MPQSNNRSRIKQPRAAPVDYQRALLKVLKLESAPIRYGKSIREIAEALGRHPDTVERAVRHLFSEGVLVKKRPPWYLRPDGKDSRTALYFFAEDAAFKLRALGMEAELKSISAFDHTPDPDRRGASAGKTNFSKEEVDAMMEGAAERALAKYAAWRGGLSNPHE